MGQYSDLYDDLIINYIQGDIQHMGYDYVYLYFRLYYVFYVINKYINKITDKDKVHDEYLKLLDEIKVEDKIYKELIDKEDYLYKTFFIDRNVYLLTYFANLIKYVLPLPFYYNLYTQSIVYRSNVSTLYKKNDHDYIYSPKDVDRINLAHKTRFNKPKNIDKIKNEIDIHVDIKYLDPTDDIYVYCLNDMVYIADKITISGNDLIIDNIYERINRAFNMKNICNAVPFELLCSDWKRVKYTKKHKMTDIPYMVGMRKMSLVDLFNVFPPMNMTTDKYKKLYHSTGLNLNIDKFLNMMDHPAYFHLTPLPTDTHYYKSRKCLTYDTVNNINNLLDLTLSVITMNPFTDYSYDKHKNDKVWKFPNLSTIHDYYKNKDISEDVIYDENFHCTTTEEKSKYTFLRERRYCDMESSIYYRGRRRLQEIIYKTRKYDMSRLYVFTYNISKYKGGFKITDKHYESSVHPYVQPYYYVEDNDLKTCDKAQIVYGGVYDTYILSLMNISGFYSTDFMMSYKTGGELLLTRPSQYIRLSSFSTSPCEERDAKFTDVLDDYTNYAYAIDIDKYNIDELKGIGMLNKLSGSSYDMLLIIPHDRFTPDYWVLSSLFIIKITYGIHHMRYLFSLTEYRRIILLKNAIMIEKLDDLFNKSGHIDENILVLSPDKQKISWPIDALMSNIMLNKIDNKVEEKYIIRESSDFNDIIDAYAKKFDERIK